MTWGTTQLDGPELGTGWQELLHTATLGAPDTPLAESLSWIAQSACEVLRCRYAVLDVIDVDGRIEHFTAPGAEPFLPVAAPRLTVRIAGGSQSLGELHVADPIDGRDLDIDDERAAISVAAAAAAVIARSRFADAYDNRQRWLTEAADVTRALLSGECADPLHLVVQRILELGAADVVAVVAEAPDGSSFQVIDAAGERAAELRGRTVGGVEQMLAARIVEDGTPRVLGNLSTSARNCALLRSVDAESAIVAPMGRAGAERGILAVIRRRGRRPFSSADVQATTMFAAQMALVLELAENRARRERMALLEERDRIARDLHDHVIQRLFAIGLSMQSAGTELTGEFAKRLLAGVDDLDETIGQIRSTIYRLTGPLLSPESSIRAKVGRVLDEMEPVLGFRPQLDIRGPVDFGVEDEIADDCLAVLREALSNVARHAHAERVDVVLALESTTLTLEVSDDGRGIGRSSRRSGLANLRARAERRRGLMTVVSGSTTGTRLTWSVPVGVPLAAADR